MDVQIKERRLALLSIDNHRNVTTYVCIRLFPYKKENKRDRKRQAHIQKNLM